jgi:hypothetical protein
VPEFDFHKGLCFPFPYFRPTLASPIPLLPPLFEALESIPKKAKAMPIASPRPTPIAIAALFLVLRANFFQPSSLAYQSN